MLCRPSYYYLVHLVTGIPMVLAATTLMCDHTVPALLFLRVRSGYRTHVRVPLPHHLPVSLCEKACSSFVQFLRFLRLPIPFGGVVTLAGEAAAGYRLVDCDGKRACLYFPILFFCLLLRSATCGCASFVLPTVHCR